MHLFRSFSLLTAFTALLGCGKDAPPSPRVDLVSTGRFQTSSRVVPPGDTLTTRVFADTPDKNAPLRRFRITVQYGENDSIPVLTYLDSTLSTQEFIWDNSFVASTNSGREIWRYQVTDTEGRTAMRQYRLVVRQPDSAQTWHSYTTVLQPPSTVSSRAILPTRRGNALPPHAARQPEFQRLIDILFVPNAAGAPTLASPTDAAARTNPVLGVNAWSVRRATGIKIAALSIDQFNQANSPASIEAGVAAGSALGTRTGALAKDQIVAFRTQEGRPGLIRVTEVTARGNLVLNVKVVR
ncbi:hypothetical protein [Hymenobacter koreensis]|uniref:Uncharacterized protein n=1 Tax=Hymenobacter koreensis TaxID=1084523 RepID=A0ABP8IXT2_9BACT